MPLTDYYESIGEAAERWGVSHEAAKKLCQRGRVPGAEKLSNRWVVPKDAWPTASRMGRPPQWREAWEQSEEAKWTWKDERR